MTSLFTKIDRPPEEKRLRIKEAIDLLEGAPCLVSKSNSDPDDRLGLYAQIEQLTSERDVLLAALEQIANESTRNLGSARIIARAAIARVKGGAAR